jgi:DNA-binding GntR family transcriptional regulator/alkylhydroperoxidase/carboxymuconolactone decarboxylase family protein YurZ
VVREAVRHLEAEGLVESFPNRGSFVKVLTVEEAAQIFDARCVLEAWATRKFVRHASDAKIEEMLHTLEESRAAALEGERVELIDKKQTYYDVIFSVYDNTYIRTMLNRIQNWNGQLRAASMSAPSRVPHAVAELDKLVDAIQRRDEKGSWEASLERVRNVAVAALSVMIERNAARPNADPSEKKRKTEYLRQKENEVGLPGGEIVDHHPGVDAAHDLSLPAEALIAARPGNENSDGLDGKTRTLLNLAIVTVLNQPEAIESQVRSALNDGVTKDEMMEVFLQTAAYSGGSAAIDTFRIARRIFDEAE